MLACSLLQMIGDPGAGFNKMWQAGSYERGKATFQIIPII